MRDAPALWPALDAVLDWLAEPAWLWPPSTTRVEALWLTLTAGGLVLTTTILLLAWRTARWQQREAPEDAVLAAIARSHVQKAAGFVLVDLACLAIGLGAALNYQHYSVLLLGGLLLIRATLPVCALLDVLLRWRVLRLHGYRATKGARD